MKDLKKQYPLLETFATLSPMPGYRKWLLNNLEIDPTIQSELNSINDIKTVSLLKSDYNNKYTYSQIIIT